jgi:outer membrane protein assembly factor BamB
VPAHKLRAILAATSIIVNACVAARAVAPASQTRHWRAYLGSALRAPAADETVNSDPRPVWRTDLGRGIVGAPALAEDVVALSLVDRHVALLDRATGEVLWRRRLSSHAGSGPLLDNDLVYVATQGAEGRVHALRLATGRTVWSFPLGDVVAPLELEEGAVYAATTGGWVARLHDGTGSRLWRTRLPGAVRAAPVTVSGGVVVATTADSVFLLERSSGAVRERDATGGTVLAAPVLVAGTMMLGTTAGVLEARDTATLAVRWRRELESGIVGMAARSEVIYVLTRRGVLWRMPVAVPESAAGTDLAIVSRAGPSPVAGGVLVTAVNGEIALVDDTGARRWTSRLEPPVREPVVVEGRMILAVSERGEVVAFR